MKHQVDTLPKALRRNHEQWGDQRVALRHKRRGIWKEYSWKDYYDNVKLLALGLKSLGFRPGEKVCIIGDNEPEWYYAELAAQALRGTAVGVLPDSSAEEIGSILSHSDSVIAYVRGQAEFDKVLQVHKDLPMLRDVIYWDPKGVAHSETFSVLSVGQVQGLGVEYEKKNPGFFEQEIAEGTTADIAILNYGSGTTGAPKGSMITHKNLLITATQWLKISPWSHSDNYVSIASPAWIMEQYCGIAGALIAGATVNFPEAPDTAQGDLREIAPSVVLFDFRTWENLSASIQGRIESGSSIRRWMFVRGLSLSWQDSDAQETSSRGLRAFLQFVADLTVFRPLRDKIGLIRSQSAYTAGGYTTPATVQFFRAIGVPLKQLYGSAETGLCCCHHDASSFSTETIGRPLPGIEMRLDGQGRMMWSGHSLFTGYHKNLEMTREVLSDGWYHEGESARVNEDGEIVFLGRPFDVINGGGHKKYSCQEVEAALRSSPYIKECIVLTSGPPVQVVSLIQIDFSSVGKWADLQGVVCPSLAALSQEKEVLHLIQEEIKSINMTLRDCQKVKKFVSLPIEFAPENGTLTRNRKVRKEILVNRYRGLLDAVFADQEYFELKSTPEVAPHHHGEAEESSTTVKIMTLA